MELIRDSVCDECGVATDVVEVAMSWVVIRLCADCLEKALALIRKGKGKGKEAKP